MEPGWPVAGYLGSSWSGMAGRSGPGRLEGGGVWSGWVGACRGGGGRGVAGGEKAVLAVWLVGGGAFGGVTPGVGTLVRV